MFDEVTARLDRLTERVLLDTLDRITEFRIVLTITRHLMEMERTDEIVALERGRGVKCGTHNELSARQRVISEDARCPGKPACYLN